jgi:hypothetical protein
VLNEEGKGEDMKHERAALGGNNAIKTVSASFPHLHCSEHCNF